MLGSLTSVVAMLNIIERVAMKKTLICGGLVVTKDTIGKYDISIVGEQIEALKIHGEFSAADFDEVIDANDLIVMPGLVEPHVHFDAPFMGGKTDHDMLTGTKACAYGGITSVISFSNQGKGESLVQNVKDWDKNNSGRAYVDWSMHGLIYDASELSLHDIPELIKLGIPTYKCFTTYRHSQRLMDDDSMLKVLKTTKENGGMLMVHCEHDATCEYLKEKAITEGHTEWIYHAKTRPARAEDMAIQRVVDLMRTENAPVYIVHASTADSVRIIAQAQTDGLPIHAETCTHYMLLTDKMLERDDGYLWVCSPPLRQAHDLERLWNAAKMGPIEVVSSDDAGLPSQMRRDLCEGRFDKVPNGMPGVEPRLTMLYSKGVREHHIDLQKMVALTSTNPAKLFGLKNKGCLAPGADADICLFDPNIEWTMTASTLHMNTTFCPFEGERVVGKAKTVLCRGEVVLRDYELVGSPAHGQRVFRELEY
ncbi:MAG: dihydropyrimidinase [Firmicutes bacterium HGW-Firmicutes-16]|nr:MAG: dihydropyrimidinase [Firmicutes bacterium HGW-Firmicutes-16]